MLLISARVTCASVTLGCRCFASVMNEKRTRFVGADQRPATANNGGRANLQQTALRELRSLLRCRTVRRVRGKRSGKIEMSGLVACFTDIALGDDGKAPTRFRIFKAEMNTSTKGNFLFDAKAAEMVMANFAKHGVRLTMDYEHQTLNAQENGKEAPASAYSWKPEVIDGELWACDVKWTEKAANYIEQREYSYQSPLFKTEPKTGRVVLLVNLALTNVPALDDQEPLIAHAASTHAHGDDPMKCKACKETVKDDDDAFHAECATSKLSALSGALGLRADVGTDVAVVEAGQLVALRSQLQSLTGKTGADIIGTISGWKANADEIVALKAKMAADEAVALSAEFEGVLTQAGTDLKVPPAEKDSLKALILMGTGGKVTKESIVGLKAYIATRQPLQTGTPTPARGAANVITEADVAAARLGGWDIKEIEAQRLKALGIS